MTTTPCQACAVQQGTHQPAEALHQIAEPDAQHLQELAAHRFTVENLRARVAELEAQLAAAQQGVQPKGEWTREVVQGSVVIRHPYGDSYEFPISTLAGYFTHPTQQGLEPTMFWDADDPERCESSINNVVVEVDNCRGLRVGDIVTIQRAVRLPNLEVRITQCPDAEGNGDLEWDEVVAAQAKQGGAANG